MADWQKVRYDPTYEEPLDSEIIALCDALNAAGFVTTSSCCGHGRGWPYVCFEHSEDERIERLARSVKSMEAGDDRPHFSMWQKEILSDGYAWCVEVRVNEVYASTSPVEFLRRAVAAIGSVADAVEAFRQQCSEIARKAGKAGGRGRKKETE